MDSAPSGTPQRSCASCAMRRKETTVPTAAVAPPRRQRRATRAGLVASVASGGRRFWPRLSGSQSRNPVGSWTCRATAITGKKRGRYRKVTLRDESAAPRLPSPAPRSVPPRRHRYPALMKAIRVHELGGPDVLRLEDVPDPIPAAGQVVIRVRAAGVNPVGDVHTGRQLRQARSAVYARRRLRRRDRERRPGGHPVRAWRPRVHRRNGERRVRRAGAVQRGDGPSSAGARFVRAGGERRRPLRDGVLRAFRARAREPGRRSDARERRLAAAWGSPRCSSRARPGWS